MVYRGILALILVGTTNIAFCFRLSFFLLSPIGRESISLIACLFDTDFLASFIRVDFGWQSMIVSLRFDLGDIEI